MAIPTSSSEPRFSVPAATSIINMFASIMHSGIPCRHYRQVVLVHPTVSELMPWILDDIAAAKESA